MNISKVRKSLDEWNYNTKAAQNEGVCTSTATQPWSDRRVVWGLLPANQPEPLSLLWLTTTKYKQTHFSYLLCVYGSIFFKTMRSCYNDHTAARRSLIKRLLPAPMPRCPAGVMLHVASTIAVFFSGLYCYLHCLYPLAYLLCLFVERLFNDQNRSFTKSKPLQGVKSNSIESRDEVQWVSAVHELELACFNHPSILSLS